MTSSFLPMSLPLLSACVSIRDIPTHPLVVDVVYEWPLSDNLAFFLVVFFSVSFFFWICTLYVFFTLIHCDSIIFLLVLNMHALTCTCHFIQVHHRRSLFTLVIILHTYRSEWYCSSFSMMTQFTGQPVKRNFYLTKWWFHELREGVRLSVYLDSPWFSCENVCNLYKKNIQLILSYEWYIFR